MLCEQRKQRNAIASCMQSPGLPNGRVPGEFLAGEVVLHPGVVIGRHTEPVC